MCPKLPHFKETVVNNHYIQQRLTASTIKISSMTPGTLLLSLDDRKVDK